MQKNLGWIFEDKAPIYREKWQEIQNTLADSPRPEDVLKMLSDIELPIEDFEKMYSADKLNDAAHYAKDLKDRYSVLWLYSKCK